MHSTIFISLCRPAKTPFFPIACCKSIIRSHPSKEVLSRFFRALQNTKTCPLKGSRVSPTKVEDLTHQTNGVRFLRQAYTDPMNKDDGSWRFIYVGPNGQLIGSLHQTSLLQNALSATGLGALTGGAGLQPLSAPGASTGANQAPGTNQANGIGQPGQQTNNANSANPLESQPQPLDGTVMGGNIIGVGSKIKKSSLRVYLGGDTYQQWEFIWNPAAAQNSIPGQAPVSPNGIPSSAPNGFNPSGMNNGQPFQMNQQPQQNQQPPTINVPPAQ